MGTKFNRTVVLLLLGIKLIDPTATSRRSTDLDADPIPNNNNTRGRPVDHDDDDDDDNDDDDDDVHKPKNGSDVGESNLDDNESAIGALGESGNGNRAGISGAGEQEGEEGYIDGPPQEEVDDAVRHGLKMMRDLYFVKEPMLYKMGLFLDPDEPAGRVAAFSAPSSKAQLLARYGYATVQASLKIAQKYNGPSRESFDFFDGQLLRTSILTDQCPLRGTPRCTRFSGRYRTPDGTCNNFKHPWQGAAMIPMQRFLPPMYEDGVQSPKRSVLGGSLPSPRDISITIHRDEDREMSAVTLMFMQWGQFLDHDVTSTAQARSFNGSVPRCCLPGGTGFLPPEFTHPECLPIPVSRQDWFLSHFGVRCLEFIRSAPSTRIDCDLGWREQINQVTSYIDASTVYGSDAQRAEALRIFRGGQLQYGRRRTQGRLHPPDPPEGEICRTGAISTACFLGGDLRVGEQPALTSLHTIWLRYHNQLAEGLQKLNRHWSDEKLYQETRRIISALIQHVTYREFLPLLLGQDVIKLFELTLNRKGYYKGYDDRINPTPANSFSTAAFRFGHSLVQNSFVRANIDHRSLLNNVLIHEEQENPENIWSPGSLDRLVLGMCNQASQRRDEFVSDELTNHLFQGPRAPFGMDLVAINVQRGRDHGIPSYTAWRQPCGLSPIENWKDLERVMATNTAERFRSVYADVDDIDLYSGGLAERPVRGGIVGPSFACVIAQQFLNFRKGDRFWYENGDFESSFTPAQLQQIRKVNLAQVICHTIREIDTIQPFVFLAADDFLNTRVHCDHPSIGQFDLSAWDEIELNSNNFDQVKANIVQVDGNDQFSLIDGDVVVIDDKIEHLITEDEFQHKTDANKEFEVSKEDDFGRTTETNEITLEISEQFSERLGKGEKNAEAKKTRAKRDARGPKTKDGDPKTGDDRRDGKPKRLHKSRKTKLTTDLFGRTNYNDGLADVTDAPNFVRRSKFLDARKTDDFPKFKTRRTDDLYRSKFNPNLVSEDKETKPRRLWGEGYYIPDVDLDQIIEAKFLNDDDFLRDNRRKNKRDVTDVRRRTRQIFLDSLFDYDDIDDDQYKRSTDAEKPPMSLYYNKQNSKPIIIRRNVSSHAKTYKPILTFANMTVRQHPNNVTSSVKDKRQQIGRTNKTPDEKIRSDFYNSQKDSGGDVFVLHNFLQGDDEFPPTYDSDQRVNDVDQNLKYNVNINIQYFLQSTSGRPATPKISKPKPKPKNPIQTVVRPLTISHTVPIYGNVDDHATKPPKKHHSTNYPIYVIQTTNKKRTTTNKPEGYDEVPIFVSGRPSGLDYVTTKRPYLYMTTTTTTTKRPQHQQTVIDEDYDPIFEDLTTRRPFPTQKPYFFGPHFSTTRKTTTRPVFPGYLYLTEAPPTDHKPNFGVQKIDDKLAFKSALLPDRFKDPTVNKEFVKVSSGQSQDKIGNFPVEKREDDFELDHHPDFLPIEDGLDVVKIEVVPSDLGRESWVVFNATEEIVDAVPELDINTNVPCASELPRPMNLSERKWWLRRRS